MRQHIVFSILFLLLAIFSIAETTDLVLARVEVTPNLANAKMPIYAQLLDASRREYALVMTTTSALDQAQLQYQIIDYCSQKPAEESYFLAIERTHGARQTAMNFAAVLADDGKQIIVRTTPAKAEVLAENGFEIAGLETPVAYREVELPVRPEVVYESSVADMINAVKQDTLFNYVGNLSGENTVNVGGSSYKIVSRYTKSGEPIQKATQYVYEFMQNLGLTVAYHDWSSWSVSNRNVIGTKLGTTKPQEIVLITAHLDCMPSSSSFSPGADDNASGSVGVMIVAEILTKYQWARTLRFVFFTGEEQGLYGSKAYATKASQDGDKIVAVYNMDMISWDSKPGTALRLHTRTTGSSGYSADKAVADLFINIAKTYSLNLSPIIDADGIQYSDHASLWAKGYPGILAIEDDADDFCANYHTSKDTRATLNFTYFTNYVKATVGTIAELAK